MLSTYRTAFWKVLFDHIIADGDLGVNNPGTVTRLLWVKSNPVKQLRPPCVGAEVKEKAILATRSIIDDDPTAITSTVNKKTA